MNKKIINVDIVIMGGGIAGLWLINRLTSEGYQTLLFEKEALGNGQTIDSQGMIHSGIKYGKRESDSSEVMLDSFNKWQQCLKGNGEINLNAVKVLGQVYLWSTSDLLSKAKIYLGKRRFRGSVHHLNRNHYPKIFSNDSFRGLLYKPEDFVVDVKSLLKILSEQCPNRIFQINRDQASFDKKENAISAFILIHNGTTYEIKAKIYILAAGEGNRQLLSSISASGPKMKKRPLHQVLVKHEYQLPLYGHCISAMPLKKLRNASPRLTVTSHQATDGNWVWYLGGDLATEHVDAEPGELIDLARSEIEKTLGWINLGSTEWNTLKINRAEPAQQGNGNEKLPSDAFAEFATGVKNVIAAWPTKLTLTPSLAKKVLNLLKDQNIQPTGEKHHELPFPIASVAKPCWERIFN